MDQELEQLLKILDAVREARNKTDYLHYRAIYESLLDDVLARHPGLSRQALDKAVSIAYYRWITAQKRPPTLPPSA